MAVSSRIAESLSAVSPRQWLVLATVVVVLIYVARIGAAGPWDPWETHYGEVARQIAVRHDPLDLWWQPGLEGPDARAEGSFASKPALPFWLMALSFRLFGLGWGADPGEMVRPLVPELALRLPSLVAGFVTLAVLALTVRALVSWRAGLWVALVLATMPQWAMVTRQALTDMFFVGPVVWALCAWVSAFAMPQRSLRRRAFGRLSVPWDRAYALFFALFLLAAVVPLAALHQHSFDPYAWDRYGKIARYAAGLKAIQVHLIGYWVLALAVFVRSLWWRELEQPLLGIVYLSAGLALMGKGLIGPGLVGAVVLCDLVVSGRWEWLRRSGLLTGIGLFVLTGFPWHHAMVLYRGEPWVNELIIQNNLQRFGSGEQEQAVGGIGFYLETLGVACLPWIAVVPVAAWYGLKTVRDGGSEDGPARVVRFALVWGLVTAWALAYSVTKYYHYLLPLLPPLAVLLAVWLERSLHPDAHEQAGRPRRALAAALGAALIVGIVRDVGNEPEWLAHLTTYLYTGFWSEGGGRTTALWATTAPMLLGLGAWIVGRRSWRVVALACWLVSGLGTTTYLLNDYVPAASESWSQRSALRLYFTQRGPHDKLVSWWFYYRGETFLTKGRVWMMKSPDREALSELVDQMQARAKQVDDPVSLWFITANPHASRLAGQLPRRVREDLEVAYESAHYTLMRLRL